MTPEAIERLEIDETGIMNCIARRLGFPNPGDGTDEQYGAFLGKLVEMTPSTVFDEWVRYRLGSGWSSEISRAVKVIYGVDLDAVRSE